jgi:hypothetical protein
LSSRARYDGTPDLLATVSSTQAWADALTSSWAQVTSSPSPGTRFKADDLEPLRVLRAELVDAVRERTAVEPSRSQAVGDLLGNTLLAGIPLTASIGQDGSVALQLAGIGWQAMATLEDVPQRTLPRRFLRSFTQQQRCVARRTDVWKRGRPPRLSTTTSQARVDVDRRRGRPARP